MSKHSETPPPPGGQFLVYQTQDGNPPFNDSDWFRKDDDVRWQFGVPPKGNANFACCSIRHSKFGLRHSPRLAPHGMAAPPCGIANGLAVAGSSNHSGEGEIRRALIEADLVDCMVALTDQLFYRTQISAFARSPPAGSFSSGSDSAKHWLPIQRETISRNNKV